MKFVKSQKFYELSQFEGSIYLENHSGTSWVTNGIFWGDTGDYDTGILEIEDDLLVYKVGGVDIAEISSLGYEYLDFNPDPSTTLVHQEGRLHWSQDDKTLELDTEVAGTTIQVGQENVLRATNNTGVQIDNGSIVRVNGATGQRPTITLANASSELTSSTTIGVVTSDIANSNTGYVTVFGIVRDLDTSGFSAGNFVFLSTTDGEFTDVEPQAPNHLVIMGVVLFSHATEGSILISVNNGWETIELHDVSNGFATTTGQTLVWDADVSIYSPALISIVDSSIVFVDASTQISRNGDNELVFYDPSAGSQTLSSLSSTFTQTYRDRIAYNSNLDTVSAPVLMRGTLGSYNMYPESKIDDNETAFETRLDSTDTWTDISTGVTLALTIVNLIAWVDANVSGSVQWEYRATITYDTAQDGETSILVDYTLA